MASIPTIPGSARVQSQEIGTKVNPGPRIQALGAFKQAVGAAQGSIDQSMQAVADYEERKRKAEEAYAFNASSLSFQKLHSDYLSNAKKQPDQQIVPNWTDTAQQWKQIQMDEFGDKLSPKAKRMFDMNLNSAIGGATAKFQVLADHLGSQRREAAAVANWGEFLKTGDPKMEAKAKSALRIAVQAGDMTQDKMDFYTSQGPRVLQKNQALNGIDNNAYATLQDLKAGKFLAVTDEDRNTLINKAERQTNAVQKSTGDDIMARFAKDPTTPASEDELEQKQKAGLLTGEFVKNYHRMIEERTEKATREAAKEKAQVQKDTANVLHMQIADHDWASDDNPDKTAREFSDKLAALPLEMQKSLNDAVKQHVEAAQKQVAREEAPVKQMAYDLGKKAYKAGSFTPPTIEDVPDTSVKVGGFLGLFTHPGTKKVSQPAEAGWEDDGDPKMVAAATVAHAEWRQKMDAFFQAKPKATPEEAEAEATRLLQPHADAQVRQSLGLNPPPAGAAFFSKSTGKWYDKNKKELP